MMYLGDKPIGIGEVKPKQWTYELYPTNTTDNTVQTIQTKVEVGQKVTIAWSLIDQTLYTNKYIWRCIGAIFEGYSGAYAGLTIAGGIQMTSDTHGQITYTVATTGNILFGGYNAERNGTSFCGNYIKVRIEDPE